MAQANGNGWVKVGTSHRSVVDFFFLHLFITLYDYREGIIKTF